MTITSGHVWTGPKAPTDIEVPSHPDTCGRDLKLSCTDIEVGRDQHTREFWEHACISLFLQPLPHPYILEWNCRSCWSVRSYTYLYHAEGAHAYKLFSCIQLNVLNVVEAMCVQWNIYIVYRQMVCTDTIGKF